MSAEESNKDSRRTSRSRSRSRGHGSGNGGNTTNPNTSFNNMAATTTTRTNTNTSSNTEFPLRILVSSEMIGAIIGRNGTTIRSITTSTRARVDVHRKENVGSIEKAITIYGNSESCSLACKKLLQVMEQEAASTQKGEISLKILAHNSLIGRIIGKGGGTIKKIMQESDTKINVSSVSEVSPGLNIERVISIRGSVDAMSLAESMISNKLKSSYENDLQALAPGGLIGGGGLFPGLHPMAMLNASGSTTTGPIHPHHHHHGHYPTAPGSSGLPTHHYPSRSQAGGLPSHHPPPYPLLGSSSNTTTGQQLQQLQQQTETVSMWIPNSSVGAVIGTKGSYIRNIIRFSGASVKIATSEKNEQMSTTTGNTNERQVTIIGSAEAQWKAQCMIFEKIREEGFSSSNNLLLGGSGIGGIGGGNSIEEPRLSIELQVPSNQVGRIIGKGGGNVRELQRLTGAIIKFPTAPAPTENPTTTTEQTSVHINGSFYSVQSAQRRIRAMLITNTTPSQQQQSSSNIITSSNQQHSSNLGSITTATTTAAPTTRVQ